MPSSRPHFKGGLVLYWRTYPVGTRGEGALDFEYQLALPFWERNTNGGASVPITGSFFDKEKRRK